ncbi:hypothetical protein BDN72DRAFT_829788 [Pluteus cervinus]|uniref:Uncharacterized protein n=1 Tax=Pluteus cervinus TaxID=181527 RepID=A0ACD3BF42_9AGAR|nr:hypothetical protein BDN72DRAFT_829788 [Pluteus cervinus]
MPSSWLFLTLSFISWARAGQITVVVDDQLSDPSTGQNVTYSPLGAWTLTGCRGCTQVPNPAQALEGTWHESTLDGNSASTSFTTDTPTATLNFYGSSISVFCIISESDDSEMNFFIDTISAGSFSRPSTGSTQFLFNVQVFSKSFTQGNHTLTIQNGQNGAQSRLLLDYIVYTFEDDLTTETLTLIPNPSSTSPSHHVPSPRARLAIILGSVFGAISLIGLIMLCFLCFRRRSPSSTARNLPEAEKAPVEYRPRRSEAGAGQEFDPGLLVQQGTHRSSRRAVAADLHDRALPTPPPQDTTTTPIANLFKTPQSNERSREKYDRRSRYERQSLDDRNYDPRYDPRYDQERRDASRPADYMPSSSRRGPRDRHSEDTARR